MISYVFETTEEDGEVSINSIPLSEEIAPLINSFNYNDLDSFYAEVENSLAAMKKEGAQYTIAYMHWGNEYQTTPSEQQETIAQELCDLGIDTLIGSHPHVIQAGRCADFHRRQAPDALRLCHRKFPVQPADRIYDRRTAHRRNRGQLPLKPLPFQQQKGKVTLEDVTFTPMWTHRYPGEKDAAFLVLPVDDTENLEDVTGVTGIKEKKQTNPQQNPGYHRRRRGKSKGSPSIKISACKRSGLFVKNTVSITTGEPQLIKLQFSCFPVMLFHPSDQPGGHSRHHTQADDKPGQIRQDLCSSALNAQNKADDIQAICQGEK